MEICIVTDSKCQAVRKIYVILYFTIIFRFWGHFHLLLKKPEKITTTTCHLKVRDRSCQVVRIWRKFLCLLSQFSSPLTPIFNAFGANFLCLLCQFSLPLAPIFFVFGANFLYIWRQFSLPFAPILRGFVAIFRLSRQQGMGFTYSLIYMYRLLACSRIHT